jgi:predicted transglutaminase-like cysteine proteinase
MTSLVLLAALATSPAPDAGTEKAKVAAERRQQLDAIAERVNRQVAAAKKKRSKRP